MSNEIYETKYGTVSFDERRGYRITSKKEGNHKKFLHRLIWEDHYGKIPDNAFIIFKDGNKRNVDISNLESRFKQESFDTEFGSAVISHEGYVQINSEKYNSRLYHRLIWEKHNGEIPEGGIIHHIDGNKLNNDISNLQLISLSDHTKLHADKDKPNVGRKHSLERKIKNSKSKNKTGYFRVSKEYGKQYKKGYRYRYIYQENGKRKEIKSVDLDKLEERVKAEGLPWFKLDEI